MVLTRYYDCPDMIYRKLAQEARRRGGGLEETVLVGES